MKYRTQNNLSLFFNRTEVYSFLTCSISVSQVVPLFNSPSHFLHSDMEEYLDLNPLGSTLDNKTFKIFFESGFDSLG